MAVFIAFHDLVNNVRRKSPDWRWRETNRLLAVDPGETTGWAIFEGLHLVDCGQIVVVMDELDLQLDDLFEQARPDAVVMEDYRVYAHKTSQHTWSNLFTPQLIGAIKLHCTQQQIPYYMQMANQAKGFCTDQKLQGWGLYIKGKKHSRDAIRHACYWLLFDKKYGGTDE